MTNPNGYGRVVRLSGNRRRLFAIGQCALPGIERTAGLKMFRGYDKTKKSAYGFAGYNRDPTRI